MALQLPPGCQPQQNTPQMVVQVKFQPLAMSAQNIMKNQFQVSGVVIVALAFVLSSCASLPSPAPNGDGIVSIIAAGDVEWSGRVRDPEYYVGIADTKSLMREDGWRRLSFVANDESKAFVEREYGRILETDSSHHNAAKQYGMTFEDDRDGNDYPFSQVTEVLRSADIAFLNLETPLSENGRLSGSFRTPPSFAKALARAGVDIVSTANNHAFDAEGEGIADTIDVLADAGIKKVGTGLNLAKATQPEIIVVDGVRVAFLAYTYGVNPTITSLGFATHERSGAAPLDPFLIRKNIESVRDNADIVVLSLHWGLENKSEVHPAAREFAHNLIDAGADVILGHHPHVPRGVEVYGDGLIIYSMGNFIFSHNHDYWGDNFLVNIRASKKGLQSAQITALAGAGPDLMQPFPLKGERAFSLLKDIKQRSQEFGTQLTIVDNQGIINLEN